VADTSLSLGPAIRIERTAEFSVPTKSKRITFVPSRGPRLPQ
jgi:hypothetical protein